MPQSTPSDRRPESSLRVGGIADGPGLSLAALDQFPNLRGLEVEDYEALDFSPIGRLHDLRKLHLGETKRRSLSLAFLSGTPLIEELSIDGTGGNDFDAVAELRHLRILTLRAAHTKTLEPLREHPTLEAVSITLGGIRDLTPLATIPNLRAVELWGIRGLDTDDLAVLGDCATLGGLSLGALPHVRDLAALARRPAETLRFLMLDGMKGLQTLRHLADCRGLEEVFLFNSRPADRQLAALAGTPALTHLHVGDPYPESAVEAALATFRGRYFFYRGDYLIDDHTTPRLEWRMRADEYLKLL